MLDAGKSVVSKIKFLESEILMEKYTFIHCNNEGWERAMEISERAKNTKLLRESRKVSEEMSFEM